MEKVKDTLPIRYPYHLPRLAPFSIECDRSSGCSEALS